MRRISSAGRLLLHARLLRSEPRQVDEPLAPHRRQVARDAAVVADELSLIGSRRPRCSWVHERARGLSARRAESRLFSAFRYSRSRKPSSRPTSMWLPRQARASPGSCRGTSAGRSPRRANASSQTSILSWSSHESKRAPFAVRALEHVAERAIAAREDALEPDSCGCRACGDRRPSRSAPPPCSQRCFSTTCSSASIAHHWKGVCGFGTCVETLTVTFGGPAFASPCDALADVARALADLHDLADVALLFGREADHEVELHAVPPAREDALGGRHELLFGDVLVHDVAHALAARLGRERDAASRAPCACRRARPR